MKRVGLLGGTFNPLHLGHLAQASECLWRARLDQVLFIPTYVPPHKKDLSLLPFDERVNLLRRSIEPWPDLEVTDLEASLEQPSYTLRTLRRLKELRPDDGFCFILGVDAFLEIESWYHYEEFLDQCPVVVTNRSGHGLPGPDRESCHRIASRAGLRVRDVRPDEALIPLDGGQLLLVDIDAISVSSTLVRERIAAGHPLRFYVPWPVEVYVRNEGAGIRERFTRS